jgi:hypothetical protein
MKVVVVALFSQAGARIIKIRMFFIGNLPGTAHH